MDAKLSNYVKDNFSGLLVFGDVHADFASLIKAYIYAKDNNLFFLSLGDLVDRGPHPFETVQFMRNLIKQGLAGFVLGNHDNKFLRYYRGASVILSGDSKQTLIDVGEHRLQEFLQMYTEIIEDPFYSALYHTFDDLVFVHAASNKMFWNNDIMDEKSKSRCLYGETTGEKHPDGLPVRLYNWIHDIPENITVMVGHDRKPIYDVKIESPLFVTNPNNGRAIFIDTGCGKGGFLTASIIKIKDDKFQIDNYIDFRE